jgi:hypothetical protein
VLGTESRASQGTGKYSITELIHNPYLRYFGKVLKDPRSVHFIPSIIPTMGKNSVTSLTFIINCVFKCPVEQKKSGYFPLNVIFTYYFFNFQGRFKNSKELL